MTASTQDIVRIAAIGIGATAAMDAWLLLLARLGVPSQSFALVGRWVGHILRGRWFHPAIAKAPAVRGELTIGWLTHYAVGIAFAALLAALAGVPWTRDPTWQPALAVGVLTVAAPWFVMQPAMGAGIAASRTPTPWKNRARSLANHAVFGLGLYLSAECISWAAR
jgi:hypothetical protein